MEKLCIFSSSEESSSPQTPSPLPLPEPGVPKPREEDVNGDPPPCSEREHSSDVESLGIAVEEAAPPSVDRKPLVVAPAPPALTPAAPDIAIMLLRRSAEKFAASANAVEAAAAAVAACADGDAS